MEFAFQEIKGSQVKTQKSLRDQLAFYPSVWHIHQVKEACLVLLSSRSRETVLMLRVSTC